MAEKIALSLFSSFHWAHLIFSQSHLPDRAISRPNRKSIAYKQGA